MFTWNSPPTGVPVPSNRCPWMLVKLVSVPLLPSLVHTTTKPPAPSGLTAEAY